MINRLQRFTLAVGTMVIGATFTAAQGLNLSGGDPGGGSPVGVLGGSMAGYQFSVIATDLEYPTGIAVDAQGDLYFTQLPTPGVPGTMGGTNKVSVRDAKTGTITDLTVGEPEPTFIEIAETGQLYWTCKSAGVILTRDGTSGEVSLFLDMLMEPSGIALHNCDARGCTVYFTQLPTPGVAGPDGGLNTVSVYQDGRIVNLTVGEPEPTEIVAAPGGTLYWTCKSAGVILSRDGASGKVSLLLNELNKPTGIALDMHGNLYFTEVPTPGVSGDNGGMNRVWKYNVNTGNSTLIHDGDPEPTDVAVSSDGHFVYWTCTVAGVIVQAEFTPAPGDLNNDGVVGVADLLILLAAWGPCDDPEMCPADLNGDGTVDVFDLLILLSNWG